MTIFRHDGELIAVDEIPSNGLDTGDHAGLETVVISDNTSMSCLSGFISIYFLFYV